MQDCEICGGNDWITVDSDWVRCARCGRLETNIPQRACSVCGKPFGKYAKQRMKICMECRESNSSFESRLLCKTPGCGNKIGKRADLSGYCKQCLSEIKSGNGNGHMWKKFTMSMITNEPTGTKDLLEAVQENYPEVTRNKLFDWLARQTKEGVLQRVGRGLYLAIGVDTIPKSCCIRSDSPSTIRIDPADPTTWGSFRLTYKTN